MTSIGPDAVESIVLTDHLRSVDWRARRAEKMYRAADEVLESVIARLDSLLISPDS